MYKWEHFVSFCYIDICARGHESRRLYNDKHLQCSGCCTPAFVAGPKLMADMMERKANQVIDHKAFGLQPKHRIHAQHGTASDDLPYAILAGAHA